jgi:hypothetical protein
VTYADGVKPNQEFENFVHDISNTATDQEKASLNEWGNKNGGKLDVKDALTWKSGPEIVVTNETKFSKEMGKIYISEYDANLCKNYKIAFKDAGMLDLYMVALLFHETVNYGQYKKDPATFRENAYEIDKRYAHKGFNKQRYGTEDNIYRFRVQDNYKRLNSMRHQ